MLCRAQQEGAPPATLAHESSSEQRTQATEPNLQSELPRSVSQEDHKQSSGIRLSLHGYQSQQQQFHCCLTSDETTSDSVLAASPSLLRTVDVKPAFPLFPSRELPFGVDVLPYSR